MNFIEILKNRRTYYNINNQLPVSEMEIENKIKETTKLVPDAFDMKSARVVVLFSQKHEQFWDEVYNIFEQKVPIEKINSFKSGAGTILFFYDENVVNNLQNQFPKYAENFSIWANQANGMLQFSIWTMLRELEIGASLQHYNPVIDEKIKETYNIPSNYKLLAQMPFGGITSEPDKKEDEDIEKRVIILK